MVLSLRHDDQSRSTLTASERRLAAIMFTDIVGFTALAQRDEQLALKSLDVQRKLVRPIFKRFGGREVKTMGDGFLVDFPSALNAVKCAYEIQRESRNLNKSLPEQRRVQLRIGIHLGDMLEAGGDISGDAVNVASRVESLAEPGGVCLSRQVYDHVQNKFEPSLISLGSRSLKNVSKPLEVYRISMPWEDATSVETGEHDTRRIAILPFANVSPDPSDEYFSDGMTDELISVLSKIKGLRVVARTSAMRYKGEKTTAVRIGQELKVGSLVEGSVRKSKNRVRIAVQLVDTKSEEQLWTETYDRDLQDVFSVQSEIARQVANSLELRFGIRESSRLQQQTQNPEAYSFYLKGRYHWNKRTESEINRAIKYYEEAIGRDPNYALAYAGLADCYSILGYYGFRRANVMFPRARELAEKALSLDGNLAEAHASLGQALMQYYFEWDRSGTELDRALELNPSYATARFWRATYYISHARFSEGLAEVDKAAELDPLSMIVLTDVARDLYLARRYDEAIERYKKSLLVDSGFSIAHKGLAEVYAQVGRHDEAISEIEKAIALSGDSVFILDDLGYIYARAGRKADALRILEDLDRRAGDEYVPSYGRAVVYAALGDEGKTMEWLQKAFEERSFLVHLKVDPAFDSIREKPSFTSLLDKVGL